MSNYKQLYWIVFVAANGGLLLGLNMAGISGAVNSIQSFFNLNDHALGIVVSSLIIGCLFGASSTGYFIEKYGRKKVLLFSSILFVISSLACALAQSYISLVIFRFIGGIGVGIVSVAVPVYISEISPPKMRGMLVSFHTLAVVTGILLAYIFNYLFIDLANGWRYMLAFPFLFSILFLILILSFLPESPRWSIANGRKINAYNVLKKIHGYELAKEEIKDIENSFYKKTKKISFKNIFKEKIRKIVFLCAILAIFQQLVGINAVINYAPIIFQKTGVGGNIVLLQSIFIGIANFLATFIVLIFIDSKGRKTLLIWGAVGMTLTLAYISYGFAFNVDNFGILIAILLYIAFFAASFASIFGVITSELFSNHFRGVAMSFTSTINWIFTFIVVQFSPYALNRFGGSVLFGIFALSSFLALIFVKIWIPETKGKSLEEIEKELTI
ncbi:MAG: sugar porter family MFS transporter [Methanobacteriaceae archaeon]|jgi:sugar porter (SP) family MFS transporter|nr:sugar porter family MFS transporter [Candidatus Methanorudis spinitermitis]